MDKIMLIHMLVMLFGVFISSFSQLLLKKAALHTYTKWYRQYLNVWVAGGYFIMFLSTLCSLVAYRVIPLSTGPIWTAAQQVFVASLSFFFLGEKPNKRKLCGLALILLGVLVFML
ncbi:MAG: EamA family transporter [Clostridia bacterium]|nr:EamA family transporter [Clostridia bacterium]